MFIRYVDISERCYFLSLLVISASLTNYFTLPFYLFLAVGLSFLLAIACLAETLPIVNNFIQLAKFPTKSSQVALLRLLLFNISSCYLIEYFSTFIFRRDVWRERNKESYHVERTLGTLAADEEERLLLEERKQNSILVYFLCLMMFNFVLKIVT